MKTIFEPADFERDDEHRMSGAVVRRITTDSRGKEHRNEAWLVGSITIMSTAKEDRGNGAPKWVLISLLDGMVQGAQTATDLCKQLNDGNYQRIVKPISLGHELETRN